MYTRRFLWGGGYNFTILNGTTAPENPKENTIWINTDIEIGEWQFSADEPTTRADGTALVEGDIWICTNIYAGTTFNAFKKNGLEVNISYCRQYNGSTWIEKTAVIYLNGAWTDIDLVIFDGTTVKNGYSFVTTKYSDTDTVVATPTIADGKVYSNYKAININLRLDQKIDLTDKTTIETVVSFPNSFSTNNWRYFYIANTIGGNVQNEWNKKVACTKTTAEQTIVMDVTEITGEYYIGVAAYSEETTVGVNFHKLKIY